VTTAVTAPAHQVFAGGLGVAFSLGASNKIEKSAVIQDVTGLHVSIRHFERPSVSSQVASLRRLLLGPPAGAIGIHFQRVKEVDYILVTRIISQLTQWQGSIPLIIETHNADIIATLLILKAEFELKTGNRLRMTITGATEAHLLAKELAEASVGVILTPVRPLPTSWEKRRMYVVISLEGIVFLIDCSRIPGPPITKDTALSILLEHGVTVGIGSDKTWSVRNLPFELAWVCALQKS